MQMTFEAVSEAQPGERWRSLLQRFWPGYRHWFLAKGGDRGPSLDTAVNRLRTHMPELLGTYERLVELADGDELAARFLACYRPPAYLVACSQAVWSRPGETLLVRNYDLDPNINEGLILHSAWNGRQVIAASECLWGASDGLNDKGLAVSLTFGGRRVVGDGFGIPLIIRYLLEVCATTAEAVESLCRIPSHMAYNVTVLDRSGAHATVMVAPDHPARVTRRSVATNHQERIHWPEQARFTQTLERERFLRQRLAHPHTTARSLVADFLRPPLYSHNFQQGFGTLFTAAYRPDRGTVTFHWPHATWRQSLGNFQEGIRTVRFVHTTTQPSQQPHTQTCGDVDPDIAFGPVRAALAGAGQPELARRLEAFISETRRGGRVPWERFGEIWRPVSP